MLHLGIHRSADHFEESERYSSEDIARIIPFGVKYLDCALKGIFPTDLVLIAADSGAGKTELATTIALNAGQSHKRVLMFALEAEKIEIERRIKFKLYSEFYLRDNLNPQHIEYDDWLVGEADEIFEPYKELVREKFMEATTNLNLCYKTEEDFGVKEFEQKLQAFRHHTDMVLVDHLHYFDTNDENEMMALGRVVKKMRHMALQEKIPIILVCHVRKKERGEVPLIPTMEDIFGHSDVYKNATKIVMLSGNPEVKVPHLRETFIHAAKYRSKGAVKNYIAKVVFNTLKNAYEPQYIIGQYRPGMKEFIPLKDNRPKWAR
jgi:replicative DNA helicase